MTPSVEAERLARESCEAFLSARIKTGSNLWSKNQRKAQSLGSNSEPRCRDVTGGGGKATKITT